MTDIHDLDQHIGRYIDVQEGNFGAAGFLVNVLDRVEYVPEPVRWITLDWGQGVRVSADTVLTFPKIPKGEQVPRIVNPIQVMHDEMHGDRSCREGGGCAYRGLAIRALRGFRSWHMQQNAEKTMEGNDLET